MSIDKNYIINIIILAVALGIVVFVGVMTMHNVDHACDECDKIYGNCNMTMKYPGLLDDDTNELVCIPDNTTMIGGTIK